MKSRTFYIFGDSICFGQYVSVHKTWCALLSTALELDNEFSNVLIQVAARNGETSRQALQRIEFDILHHRPTVVLAQFGLNDANYWITDKGKPRVDSDEYVDNMLSIANQCLANGTSRVILANNHPISKNISHMPKDAYIANTQLYNNLLRGAITKLNNPRIMLLDIEQAFLNQEMNNVYLLADGIHLNDAGHRLYFSYSSIAVKSALAAPN